ncbi:MAG: serine/threonine protein kinase, partial [Arthrospira sp. PLM2.Bin9]
MTSMNSMQSAIPLGTVLQNRYRLIRVLGQGGFGLTYLAEDLGRFNEYCALKEFTPVQMGTYAWEKSKELFRREAQVLYQIQHPQIPKFGAVFEENQRLFLVQDYVEGQTYYALLKDRKNAPVGQPRTFAEAEVITFLEQMLPVLEHLHSLNIIHRDISPDNIIRRDRDQLPVLIDFGVVIEQATYIQSPGQTQPVGQTRVGKLGYAPAEQMQTGKVSPSSDLYALAVTAIFLLTGREPQDLINQQNLTWMWEPWATVTPQLAAVLNKMLSRNPGDRYQSAREVQQALNNLSGIIPTPPTTDPNLSGLKTLAVGSPVSMRSGSNHQTTPVISTPSLQSFWNNPVAVISAGIAVAIIAGYGSWSLVSYLLNSSGSGSDPDPITTVETEPRPRPRPRPTPTPTPEPTPT